MPLLVKGIFFALWFPFSLQAQFYDPIKEALQDDTPGIDLRYDSRNSFVGSRFARINGVKLGVSFDESFKLGMSYNWLSSEIKDSLSFGGEDREEVEYVIRYWAPYADWAYYKDDKWKITMLAMLGGGTTAFRDDNEALQRQRFLLLYEPYMAAERRVLKYFGIGAGVGFRLVLIGDNYARGKINSPIYVVRAAVYFRDLKEALRQ